MWKRVLLLGILGSAALAAPRERSENWIELQSPHFVVVTNASEKRGRHVADQFERMRSVFHSLFPKLPIDPGSPIVVLALKEEKDFQELEPAAYLAKGQIKLGGLFLRTPDKNYVLMRLDAEWEHPYAVVYHEYTHLLLSKAEWMPLWLNEGLAEFYQNTEIRDKDVALGEASEGNIRLLRQTRLLPLATLFAVDAKSPYYHEENKGSIFYAEAWAMTHYIQVKDGHEKAHRLGDYAELLAHNVDSVTAATRAFGDLKQLQKELEEYVGQERFNYFKIPAANDIDDATFKVRDLPPTQADAVRADVLAYTERVDDARALLGQVLKDDPGNASAHETMGYLAFRQGHQEEGRDWYAQAVKLDSQNYLAHYYFAAIAMNGAVAATDEAQVESSLRAAIKLNPSFAPAYDRLAVFLGTRHRNLDEAHLMAMNAVQLDPQSLSYRVNAANVLIEMQRDKDAVRVLSTALHLAKSPQESAPIQTFLEQVERQAAAREEARRFSERIKESGAEMETSIIASGAATSPNAAKSAPPDEVLPRGPRRFVVGVLKNVRCDSPAMNLDVITAGKSLGLQAQNYYKIVFTALGFTPKGNLNPCMDVEGRTGKVEYVESPNPSTRGQVVSVELHN